jgi:hypothetical protein
LNASTDQIVEENIEQNDLVDLLNQIRNLIRKINEAEVNRLNSNYFLENVQKRSKTMKMLFWDEINKKLTRTNGIQKLIRNSTRR